jgi:hypothetical protein
MFLRNRKFRMYLLGLTFILLLCTSCSYPDGSAKSGGVLGALAALVGAY